MHIEEAPSNRKHPEEGSYYVTRFTAENVQAVSLTELDVEGLELRVVENGVETVLRIHNCNGYAQASRAG